MKIKTSFTNPFVLTAKGFLFGALILWAAHGEQGQASSAGAGVWVQTGR